MYFTVSTLIILQAIVICFGDLDGGMLFPKDTETREVKDLSGMWKFLTCPYSDPDQGFREKWYQKSLAEIGPAITMPVPSSFNDITVNKTLRDYVGWVWYDHHFFVPSRWRTDKLRVVLRFGSLHYVGVVWLNGIEVMSHIGGHLPFEAEVPQFLKFGSLNRITVAINNTLNSTTIPPGTYEFKDDTNRYPPGYFVMAGTFDFFNYAGIHRPVKLYTTPTTYIDDITIVTDIDKSSGIVHYSINSKGKAASSVIYYVEVYDKNQTLIDQVKGQNGTITIQNPRLWWPYTMNEDYGYLYTLKVRIQAPGVEDIYYQKFGIRTINVTNTQFFINDKPFYFRGFGKHEDSDIRGKGLDNPLIARDFNLIHWIKANSYRTSHYPYAEEIMDQSDEMGIVVIDECPAVGLSNFVDVVLERHLIIMNELVRRDKNHPSVVMWSVGNEPQSTQKAAADYFKTVISETKRLDPSRPVTLVLGGTLWSNDKAAQYLDVLSINRYFGWYGDTGHTEVIEQQVLYELTEWFTTFNKPVLITEYGADTVAGLHQEPSFIFTEEYQVDFMNEYFKGFDQLRPKFLIGEMIWNFADFMTSQQIHRVVGNRKGIFTRQRQPKAAAHLLRCRYDTLAKETGHIDNVIHKFGCKV